MIALLSAGQVLAQDLARPALPAQPAQAVTNLPRTVIAVTRSGLVLLRESCGWPGGAMRAYQITGDHVAWACWGYNETGIQFQWATGQHTQQFWPAFVTDSGQALTYHSLYHTLNPVK